MNKTVTIIGFKSRMQERLRFVRTLSDFNKEIGLKQAKLLQDKMLEGHPINYQVQLTDLEEFTEQLCSLGLDFKID